MKRWSIVLIALFMLILTGCSEERVAPDVFLKQSWTSTYLIDFEQIGQKYDMDITLALDPKERQNLLDTLPYESSLRQMPFGILLQTDLTANLTGDYLFSMQSKQYGGKMKANLDLGMLSQEFPLDLFMDYSGPEGGLFISIGKIWQLVSPYSVNHASMASLNNFTPQMVMNWDEYLQSLPEEQQAFIKSMQTAFFTHLTITKDESEDGLRIIEGDLDLAHLVEEVILTNLENEAIWKNEQFIAATSSVEREQLQQYVTENKDTMINNVRTYTQGIEASILWIADEKTKKQQEMEFTLKINKDAQIMNELSTLLQLDQPIHPTLVVESHFEMYEVSEPRTIRPASLTQEEQQYLVAKDRENRLSVVNSIQQRVAESIQLFYEKNQQLPATFDELAEQSYYDLLFMDFFTMRPLIYQANGQEFKLISVGPDGQLDTADDIVLTQTVQ